MVRQGTQLACQAVAHDLHFVIRQGCRDVVKTYQSRHARNLQDTQTFLERKTDKYITREEWNLEPLSAISPFPYRLIDRKKMLYGPSTELLGDALLVVCSRMDGVPTFVDAVSRQIRAALGNRIAD